jgi:hypothetical protein
MTPREKRELITGAIIDDIMENITEDDSLGIIRDALENHLARWRAQEVEDEYQRRGFA